MMRVNNVTRKTLVADKACEMRTPLQRMRGLLGRKGLAAQEALVFPRCNAIHTWGMRFCFDAIFVDGAGQVVSLREKVAPWRIVGPVGRARTVIEAACGTIRQAQIRLGDTLQFVAKP